MIIDKIEIPLKLWQIEEILQKRVEQQGFKIEELFMVWSSHAAKPDPKFYDTFVETKYGRLRFFFIPELEPGRAFVLNHLKFPFPKKNNHSGYDLNGDLVH